MTNRITLKHTKITGFQQEDNITILTITSRNCWQLKSISQTKCIHNAQLTSANDTCSADHCYL